MSKKSKITRPSRDPDHYSKRGVPYWWSPEFVRGTSSDLCNHEQTKHAKDTGRLFPDTLAKLITDANGEYVIPCDSYGRIHAVKSNGDVKLYMKSKDGNLSYIQGSIQKEFKKWHTDREIDYILLGMDPDEIITQEE